MKIFKDTMNLFIEKKIALEDLHLQNGSRTLLKLYVLFTFMEISHHKISASFVHSEMKKQWTCTCSVSIAYVV
jgi:hypothetical protein